jgi:esterase/lipase
MKRTLWLCVLLFSCTVVQARDCVVLLHGLARTSTSMNKMQRELDEAGYRTANIDYPSRDYTVEELAESAVADGLQACRKDGDHPRTPVSEPP